MYAVLGNGGKQYRVAVGDTVRLETIAGEVGSTVELKDVVALVDNGTVTAGAPAAAARVKGTIAEHGRGDKVIVFKFKRKKQYKKTIGHRQNYTAVKLDEIVAYPFQERETPKQPWHTKKDKVHPETAATPTLSGSV